MSECRVRADVLHLGCGLLCGFYLICVPVVRSVDASKHASTKYGGSDGAMRCSVQEQNVLFELLAIVLLGCLFHSVYRANSCYMYITSFGQRHYSGIYS